MVKKKYSPIALFLSFLIFGCASLQTGYEEPSVSITSFEAVPTQGLVPQFKIGLHIVNPNRTALSLKGISYSIFLEEHKVMTGVSNKLPKIEAYGEGDVTINASLDFFNSIGFFTDLVRNQKREKISYSFEAKLDAGSLYPLIRITETGKISLSDPGIK